MFKVLTEKENDTLFWMLSRSVTKCDQVYWEAHAQRDLPVMRAMADMMEENVALELELVDALPLTIVVRL